MKLNRSNTVEVEITPPVPDAPVLNVPIVDGSTGIMPSYLHISKDYTYSESVYQHDGDFLRSFSANIDELTAEYYKTTIISQEGFSYNIIGRKSKIYYRIIDNTLHETADGIEYVWIRL